MEAPSHEELKNQLVETGTQLLHHPPSSVEELLPLLNRALDRLAFVFQNPCVPMLSALSPLIKALVAETLFKHSDADVKVAVAACISDIMRIYAPSLPYKDDQMKEVFQLILASFENLSDKSSRTYALRTQILEIMAQINLSVEMVNLKCHKLVVEMFQHFLKTIRDDHPENVFSSMETIMTSVLEECDVLHPDLLSPITDYVKKDNKVPHISRKLAEQVLRNSATKIIPYLTEIVRSLILKCKENASDKTVTVADLGDKEKRRAEQEGKEPLLRLEQRTSSVLKCKENVRDKTVTAANLGDKEKRRTNQEGKKPLLRLEQRTGSVLKCKENARDKTVADSGDKGKRRANQEGKEPLLSLEQRTSHVRGEKLSKALSIGEEKKRQARRRAIVEVSSDSSSDDNDRPFVSAANLAKKSSKDEEESPDVMPKTSVKRKLDNGEEKVEASNDNVYGENLVGFRIKVWWPLDGVFYDGVIKAYVAATKKHVVLYDGDGERETLNLKKEKWEFINQESESSKDEDPDWTIRGATSRTCVTCNPPAKKSRSGKQITTDATAAKGGGAAPSKSRPPASSNTKSGEKQV